MDFLWFLGPFYPCARMKPIVQRPMVVLLRSFRLPTINNFTKIRYNIFHAWNHYCSLYIFIRQYYFGKCKCNGRAYENIIFAYDIIIFYIYLHMTTLFWENANTYKSCKVCPSVMLSYTNIYKNNDSMFEKIL